MHHVWTWHDSRYQRRWWHDLYSKLDFHYAHLIRSHTYCGKLLRALAFMENSWLHAVTLGAEFTLGEARPCVICDAFCGRAAFSGPSLGTRCVRCACARVCRLYDIRSADLPTVMMQAESTCWRRPTDTTFHAGCRSARYGVLYCTPSSIYRSIDSARRGSEITAHLLTPNAVPSRAVCSLVTLIALTERRAYHTLTTELTVCS